MSVATITPHPRLAVVASEARQAERARKREANPLRKVVRGLTVTIAILFATLGLGAGTAQAWPWSNMQEDITAFVTNFCGPEDVPMPTGHGGLDNLFGLNTGESDLRGTVTPNTSGLGASPVNGLERIQTAYDGESKVISPSYERYGFSTLTWDSYGAGCFDPGYWFTPVANIALHGMVMVPMMAAMAALQMALGNMLYTIFTGIISPFVSIFTTIFEGWALWIAPIGIIWAFIRSKGNLREVAKTGAWMLMIFGVFIWMGNNTSTIVTKANNFVTEVASSAATQINEINGVSTGTDGTAVDDINQSLWYGVPYQTWLEGQVGPSTAASDRTRINNGEVSWGAVILNSKYVGDDDAGRDVVKHVNVWNGLSYSPNEEFIQGEILGNQSTKPGAWTKGKIWEKVPYLFNVKALCGDTSNGTLFTSSSAQDDNLWFYGGACDSASAGTTAMIPHFTGTNYNSRLTTAVSGGIAAFAVVLAIAIASIYLGVQKMLFYFLLLFGPIFLTVAMWGDQKRAAFAKRYFELMIGNLLKQGVAVLVVLFIANSMSMLLYPPADESFAALREIPWMLRPTMALLFLIGLALFLVPLKKIVTGAVKGDTQVVDKTARMPVDAAKTTAKVAGVATVGVGAVAAIAATGGAAAPLIAKAGGMAMSAGRMMGSRGGVGKVLTGVGRVANLSSRIGGSVADHNNKKGALSSLAKGMFARDKGVQDEMAKVPGALDKNGNLTSKGEAVLSDSIKKTSKKGEQNARAEALQKSYMDKFYKGHLAQTGKHHAQDPNSPDNLRAAAVQREADKQAVKAEAKHGSNRSANMSPEGSGPNTTNNTNSTNGANGTVGSEGAPTAEQAAKSQRAHAETARENVSGPGFAQDQNIKANVSVDGAKVAEQMGMTSRDLAQDPSALLTGNAYGGGDVSKMDPRHPATASMNDLKFAMLADDQKGIEASSIKASDAIAQHGAPSEITSVSAVSATPQGMATAIGAMPSISDDTPWQVRAEGATTMQAAMSFVSEDSAAYAPMTEYVSALSTPSVDASTVEGLRAVAIEASAPDLAAEVPAHSVASAIPESAERVSAAPEAVVAEQGGLFGESVDAPSVVEVPRAAPSFANAGAVLGQEALFGGDYAGEPIQDAMGNVYHDLPREAVEAMPMPPQEMGSSDFSAYRESMESWNSQYVDPGMVERPASTPAGYGETPLFAGEEAPRGRHSGGGYSDPIPNEESSFFGGAPNLDGAASAIGGAIGGALGRGGGADTPPEDLEDISDLPYDPHEDNSVPYRRSKRRRISGMYDTEGEDTEGDDTEGDEKGGE